MKYVKMLSLVALAAMALMAGAGAGSASASTLCRTSKNPCPVAWKYLKGTTIHITLAPGSSMVLRTNVIIGTCTGSTFHITIENAGSTTENVSGTVSKENLTWSGCESTTDTLAGGTLEVEASSEGNGVVKAKGFEWTSLTSGVSCVYGAGTGITLGNYTTSNKHITVNTTVKKLGGSFLCPSSLTWEATYVVNEPTETVYVDTGVE